MKQEYLDCISVANVHESDRLVPDSELRERLEPL